MINWPVLSSKDGFYIEGKLLSAHTDKCRKLLCVVPIYLQNLVSGVVLLKTKHSLLYLKKNTAQKGKTVPSKLKLLILYSSIMYVT